MAIWCVSEMADQKSDDPSSSPSLATSQLPDSNSFSTYLAGCSENTTSLLLTLELKPNIWHLSGMQLSLSE